MVSIEDARRNRLLALLPRDDLKRLLPDLEAREISIRTVLQPPGELSRQSTKNCWG